LVPLSWSSCANPSLAGAESLLRERRSWDEDAGTVDREKIMTRGGLIAYAITSGGFDEASLGLLKEWFDSGVLYEELKDTGSTIGGV
jgi:hypothetical protein